MIMAYHRHRGDLARTEIIVPDAAHGTNPATATVCGCSVREIPTMANGDIDIDALKKVLGPNTAGIMLTNPSTIGVFERRIVEIARLVHEAGGLLYYDGANLNAILGKVRPGDMGFDAIHMNLHKTFSTPHGGGGPGAGAVGVSERLRPFLPIPMIEKVAGLPSPNGRGSEGEGPVAGSSAALAKTSSRKGKKSKVLKDNGPSSGPSDHLLPKGEGNNEGEGTAGGKAEVSLHSQERPPALDWSPFRIRRQCWRAASRLHLCAPTWARGDAAGGRIRDAQRELPRRAVEEEGLHARVSRASRVARVHRDHGAAEEGEWHLTALDFSKSLLDYGIHAPTNYFPLLVPECMLIEPTETESKETLDRFVVVMKVLLDKAANNPEWMKGAPYTTPVRRLDDVKAAKELDLAYVPPAGKTA